MSDDPSPSRVRVEEQFSLPLFVFTIAVSLAGLAIMLKLVAPDAVWEAQFAGVLPFVAAFLVMHLVTAFIEFIFHRWVLHKPVVPFLSHFYKQHTLHHSLTRIGKRFTPGGREVPYVENIYPVTTLEQGEASFFPWFTMAIFAVIVTPLLVLLHWLAPGLPWFFAGYAAVAFGLSLYEVFHAIEHWDFDRWAPLIEHPRYGWFWRKVYSFHLRHHAVIDCNEAISGFFTLPVFDWLFGTFVLPRSLYVDGSEWQASEFTSPRPIAPIRWIDRQADAIVKARRARAAAPVPSVANYTRGEQIAHHLTHWTGLAASVGALVLLVAYAVTHGGGRDLAGAILFGAGLVAAYSAFTNFRKTRPTNWRELFRRWDHAAMFLLIAGTATPFLLRGVGGAWGWSLIAVVWALCAAGAGTRLFFPGRLDGVARAAYLLLGLVALIALKPLVSTVPQGAVWLLLAGGLCYGCGAAFHLWQRLRYHLLVRHAFAFGGSACHIIAVLAFVLPRAA